MDQALEVTTLVAAALNVVVAALLVLELRRRPLVWPPILLVLVLFFLARTAERLTEPEAPGGYSTAVDLGVDVVLMALLALIVAGARRLADAAQATYSLAAYRVEEYARAGRDYRQLVRHRIANPLTVIRGAAETLAAGVEIDPATRRRLLDAILEAVADLERVSVDPDVLGPEERALRPRPVEPGR